jgi:putative redox protein
MKATVKWRGGMAFEGTTGSGHTVNVDGPPDLGGEDSGPRPMELMQSGELLGGGCCPYPAKGSPRR